MDRLRHVLVVDDDGSIRGLLTAALEDRGDRVTSVADGRSMRDALSRDRVDVVVLDVRLPGEGGHSLALHVQELGLPVILISGSGDVTAFAERHNLTLLRKPFSLQKLLGALDAALASRGGGEEHA
jgi:two-component system OmpR family response regulator